MDGDELVFLYQLKEGICQSSYAANIATLAGLPTSIVQRGVEVNTHTHTQIHRSMLTLTDCVWLVRCLTCTGQEDPSNALTKHHLMSRQTGLLNSSCTEWQWKLKRVVYVIQPGMFVCVWRAGAGLWWRGSWTWTWRTKTWTFSTSWKRSSCPLLGSCWTSAKLFCKSFSTALRSVCSFTIKRFQLLLGASRLFPMFYL